LSTSDRTLVNGVLGTHLRDVEVREGVLLVTAFLVLAGLSLVVVDRRRPY
jgi:hypothetical protein